MNPPASSMIDLSKFCGESDVRYAWDKPWRVGDVVFATDGRVLIEVPADSVSPESLRAESERRPPECSRLLKDFPASGFAPWPEAQPESEHGVCLSCDGAGLIGAIECERCEGFGSFETKSGSRQCQFCNGRGLVGGAYCTTCDGKRELVQPRFQKIGAAWLKIWHDALIRELPDVECVATHADKAIAFRFTGGRGLVMPVDREWYAGRE